VARPEPSRQSLLRQPQGVLRHRSNRRYDVAFGLAHWNEGALRRLSYHGPINYIPGYLHWYTGSSLGVLLVMKHHGRFSCEKKRGTSAAGIVARFQFSLTLARYHVIRGFPKLDQLGVQQQDKALAGAEEEGGGPGWCGAVACWAFYQRTATCMYVCMYSTYIHTEYTTVDCESVGGQQGHDHLAFGVWFAITGHGGIHGRMACLQRLETQARFVKQMHDVDIRQRSSACRA